MSPTLTSLMSATLPVTLVAPVTAAVTRWPSPAASVIDVALTAVTLPPISSRSVWPGPGVGIGPPPVPGGSRVPAPPPGAVPPGPALGPVPPGPAPPGWVAPGDAFAAGLAVPSGRTAVTTANPAPAASTAVAASAAARRPR